METNTLTILVVDDTAVDRTVARHLLEKRGGWRVELAKDGALALDAITRSAPAAVLTDMQMPNLNGLELVKQVRERFSRVPVILMTGNGSEEIALTALRAGAASYVPKRNLATDLVTIVEQILSVSQADDHRARIRGSLSKRMSQYTLANDTVLVRSLVHVLREELLAFGLCDDTSATQAGVALEGTLLNAIYHGNLNINSKLKLRGDGSFERAVAARRREALFCDRRVTVTAEFNSDEARFVIADEGAGFDVATLPKLTDSINMDLPGGRGVLFMRTFMDEVRYNRVGNQVTLVKRRETHDQRALSSLATDMSNLLGHNPRHHVDPRSALT